jgi:hypothetical protein
VQLGWQHGRHTSRMYFDGHEQEDVVKYRHAFVGYWAKYESRFHLNSTENPLPFTLPVIAGLPNDPTPILTTTGHHNQSKRLILITHDESTFFQNDQRKIYWEHSTTKGTPKPKGNEYSLMILDFLTAEWGHLCDNEGCVITTSLFIMLLTQAVLKVRRMLSSSQENSVKAGFPLNIS